MLQNGSSVLEDYKCGEFNLLGNFLVSDGKPGKVWKVYDFFQLSQKDAKSIKKHNIAYAFSRDFFHRSK